jgi:hypothetical protein
MWLQITWLYVNPARTIVWGKIKSNHDDFSGRPRLQLIIVMMVQGCHFIEALFHSTFVAVGGHKPFH